MSVLKSLRNLSDMEFYKNAKVLRNEITNWMLRNFGAKYKLKDVKILAKNISDVDKNKIYEILEPYDLNDNKAFNLAVPDWFYDSERKMLYYSPSVSSVNMPAGIRAAKLNEEELYRLSFSYDAMAVVKKMKQIVPEFKSHYSRYEVLD